MVTLIIFTGHLVRLMDAKLSRYGNLENQRKCEITLTEICYLAGMSPKPAMKYLKQLIGLKMIELVQKLPRNRSVYKLGIMFSDWENLPNCNEVSLGDLAVSLGVLENSLGETPILYINKTSNKTNNKGGSFSENQKKDYKQENPSPKLQEYMNKTSTHH